MAYVETFLLNEDDQLAHDAMSLIVTQVYGELPQYLPASIQRYIEDNSDPEDFTHLALLDDDQTLIGAASICKTRQSKEIEVYTIAINPELQGQGHGTAFLGYIAKLALAEGNDKLSLYCADEAVQDGFYRKLGFTPLNEDDPEELIIDAAALSA